MNFNQLSYLPGLILCFAVFLFIVIAMETRFFKFVKTYWFFNRSIFSYSSTFVFVIGMGGLLLSLLDLRGPEEKIKTQIPSDRTIILIDTSASMLAEDVKPSRLQKAALIAKHFARKAAGHQLSIVAFAEVQKKIVPFTNDIDLIDARLDSLENLRNQYGSSALTTAIQESIQYFKETGGEERGNILIFTDGEETAEGIDLKIPKEIHIALVGIGTTQGGRIPLDDGRGFRYGYKKSQGRDIITKLNENFFRRLVDDIPSAKYWATNSYSLPSEEILDFFKTEKVKGNDQQDMVVRPVLMEWIVIPSLIFLLLSFFLKAIRIFSLLLFLIFSPVHAQQVNPGEIQLSEEIIQKMNSLQRGELNRLEKIKLADDLNKAGAKDESLALYDESLPFPVDKNIPPEAYLNFGTALMSKGDPKRGLEIYNQLREAGIDSKTQEVMDKNVVSYFQQQEQKKKEDQQKKNDDQKEKKDQQDQKNDQQNKSGKDQQKNQKDKKQNGSEDKKENKKDDIDKKENENQDDKKKNENVEQNKKPMPTKKIPAKLKQLMSDDRQLQMKMIENGTRELNKRKSPKSKDW
jgi:Ca-activated chloride channel family protein